MDYEVKLLVLPLFQIFLVSLPPLQSAQCIFVSHSHLSHSVSTSGILVIKIKNNSPFFTLVLSFFFSMSVSVSAFAMTGTTLTNLWSSCMHLISNGFSLQAIIVIIVIMH